MLPRELEHRSGVLVIDEERETRKSGTEQRGLNQFLESLLQHKMFEILIEEHRVLMKFFLLFS